MLNKIATAPTNAPQAADAAPPPADAEALNQASANFAALLHGRSDQPAPLETSRRKTDDHRADESRRDDQAPADHGRVERRRGDERRSGKDDEEHGGRKGGGDPLPTPGELMLQALGSRRSEPAEATADAAAGHAIQEISQAVADRILVSDPSVAAGRPEVRIQLKDSVLPGTEVRLVQEAGRLQVTLTTDRTWSFDLLAQQQAALEQRLQQRLGTHVVVQVSMESQAEPFSSGRDAFGRAEAAAGHDEHAGQGDRDGRSRNPRDPNQQDAQ